MRRREFLASGVAMVTLPLSKLATAAAEQHLLYIATPGIRSYVSYGGVGVLVFDIGDGYKFVKRIPTWNAPPGQEPENVKGVEASAATRKLYVSTTNDSAASIWSAKRWSGKRSSKGVATGWRSRRMAKSSSFPRSKVRIGTL